MDGPSISDKRQGLSCDKHYYAQKTCLGAQNLQLDLWCKGARVWIPDKETVWRGAQLLEDYKGQKELRIVYEEEEEEDVIKVPGSDQLPPLRNPEILIGENDLTSLSYLHEPAVLYNLKVRFSERNDIYTYCGIVLVAINPYEQLPIYDIDTIQAYSGQDMGNMDPHIFAVAEEAFKNMASFDQNQSIIVSGESGAGKTVSAKYAMRYFATVGGAQAETQIEKKVLASNPIMESIGNAKTIRNDNSSRFGKYIEISFNKNNNIIGAHMRTYLLEKSRVVFQASSERNYHIFYQLCACSEMPELEFLQLNSPDIFYYTNQGEDPIIDGVDDAEELMNTREAFSLLGMNEKVQFEIFRILSGILHMGNVVMEEKDNETCAIPKTDKHLPIMSELFGINEEQIRKWLCARKIVTVGEVLTKPLTITQAYFARDALAKHIYAKLFNYIVTEVNKALTTTSKKVKFIGVLDIYGFETFEVNSFEQFCINYANEKLQQQFCLHVFKLEQEEYVKEQIEWSFIDFYDNQPCIDLIEGKLGILDLLDEECKMPKGSDKNWCFKLYDKHSKTKHFSKPRMSNEAFIIHHFADLVEYTSEGFLEKNRDTLIEEHINILKASEYELVAELFSDEDAVVPAQGKPQQRGLVRAAKQQPKAGNKQHKKSVGSQFRESLTLLMHTLNSTTPHYVRCIKPNDNKMAFEFEPKRAVQQLRACGVLETIRISAAGYPSRWTYPDFFRRYRVLARSKEIIKTNMKKTCENILTKLIEAPKPAQGNKKKDRDKYQFGKTKIFFRAGQVAYLEKLRSDRLRTCGVLIQKHVRGWLARRKYMKIKRTVLLVQTFGRGKLARGHALYLRRTAAATAIQTCWRRFSEEQRYKNKRKLILKLQCSARGMFARKRYEELRRISKATIIQRTIRGWLQRRLYHRVLRGIIKLQSHVRRRAAKRELKRLKVEARSVEHIKNVNKGLENKIIELQQKLDTRNKEMTVVREELTQFHDIKNSYEKLKHSQAEKEIELDRVKELELLIEQLKKELDQEKGERKRIQDEKEKLTKEKDGIIEALNHEKSWLKDELEKANQQVKQAELEGTDNLKHQLEESLEKQKREFDKERSHHQKLVKDYARLQQRLENLQVELKAVSPTIPGHRRSASELSNISLESESSTSTERDLVRRDDEGDEDLGYGSSRRKEKEWHKARSVDSIEPPKPGVKVPLDKDLHLVTRLQNRVKELEKDKARLAKELDRRENKGGTSLLEINDETIYETIKVQELEMENSKLKDDLNALRASLADGSPGSGNNKVSKEMLDQFQVMSEELDRRRDECIQLRSLMAQRAKGIAELSQANYGGDTQLVNEDGELEMAYKTQKQLNALLENQLQQLEKTSKEKEKEYTAQIEELKAETEKQQKLIGQEVHNLTLTPEARIEATMQHEITRLTSENLDLREQIDKQQEQIKKLKKALKIYAKRLKSTEGGWRSSSFMSKSMSVASDIQAELEKEIAADEGLPAVRHVKEREYCGMFEYRKEDEPTLVRHLIIELKPRLASQALPGLPAYIMFMCIRHTDYMNDDTKVRSLLTSSINGIKKIVKKKQDDVETTTLWLANTCRLLHNLKQYSGDKAFQSENTPKQNEHCLRNFDLSEYRQILSDLAVWIYQGLIKLMSNQIQPVIVGAILEHEAIAGLSSGKPTGLRGRSSTSQQGDVNKDAALDQLMKSLNNFVRVLNLHAVDPELVKQVFRQLLYFICANALNNLLLRKDMCHWSKGMQIRYNMSHLEQWLRDNRLQDVHTQTAMEPIIQASQLLQARKTVEDVESICEMCSRLTTSQIIKILNLYTPVNEFEERVPISFIRKIQEHLQKKRKDQTQGLLMDTKFFYAVTFPFNPSSISLETLLIPPEWGLGFLKRL